MWLIEVGQLYMVTGTDTADTYHSRFSAALDVYKVQVGAAHGGLWGRAHQRDLSGVDGGSEERGEVEGRIGGPEGHGDHGAAADRASGGHGERGGVPGPGCVGPAHHGSDTCLLYTSDAANE